MNANELADLLDFDAKTLNWKAFADAATMLRQQQAEIEALKKELAHQHRWNGDVDFARAILKKASEK